MGEGGGGRPRGGGTPWGGNPTSSRIRPPLSYSNKEKGEGEGGEKERGAGPPSPIRFGLGGAPPLGLPPLFHY